MPPGFLKAALRDFEAYTPGQQPPDGEGWVKLNTNESPWPPAPSVLAAVRAAVGGELRLYPDPMARAARAAIAEFHRLPPQWVSVGNGGDELLTLAFRAFVGSGDAVAFLDPSYPLLASLAALHEARANLHPLDAEWAPPKSFAEDDCVLKILVNPNSPTGTWVGREAVREVVESSPGVVVLDEAYVDFAPADQVELVRAGTPNLIILRTFSKSYALAGMRLGYALAPPPLIEALDLVKDSYNVDRLAIVAARAAILDSEYHDQLVAFVLSERAWLEAELVRRDFAVLPSATNFLFCRPRSGAAAERIFQGLQERRVLVRHYDREPIQGWIRITIGTRGQHQLLLSALDQLPA